MNGLRIGFYKNDGAEKFYEFFRILETAKVIKNVEYETTEHVLITTNSFYTYVVKFYSRCYQDGKKIKITFSDGTSIPPLIVDLPGEVIVFPDLLTITTKYVWKAEEGIAMRFFMKGSSPKYTVQVGELLLSPYWKEKEKYVKETEFEEEE